MWWSQNKKQKTKSATPRISEWSSNFDIDRLEQLLNRVGVKAPHAVSIYRQQKILEFVRTLKHNDEKPISFSFQHNGELTSLGLSVFMDDIEAPDVTFFAPHDLITLIRSEDEKLCDELGI